MRSIAVVLVFMQCILPGYLNSGNKSEKGNNWRDPSWAVPITRPGLPNLHRVSEGVYRGGQPVGKGYPSLRAMGIRTIINFSLNDRDRKNIIEGGLSPKEFNLISIPVWGCSVRDRHIQRYLKVMADGKNYPVYIHCRYGSDRTGIASAMYRIVFQNWDPERAIEEMRKGGYGFRRQCNGLVRLIRSYDPVFLRKRYAFKARAAADAHK